MPPLIVRPITETIAMRYNEAFRVLHDPASDINVSLLASTVGSLPYAYLDFLQQTDGAEDALHQADGYVRLHSVTEALRLNTNYKIQEWLPQLWMIGDDGGDYGYCLDRSGSSPDEWPVIEAPLGALFADDLVTLADSFSDWRDRSFVVRHGFSDPALPEQSVAGESWIILDGIGPSVSDVARITRSAIGGTAADILALVRSPHPVLLRCPSWQRWRLEQLLDGLLHVGALATIHDTK